MKSTVQVNKLKKIIETTLDTDKASDIAIIDMAQKSSLADYMIIATGLSQKHITALAERLVEKLDALGIEGAPVEGRSTDWIVVDAGNIIIHLFRAETRSLYNLEKMWAMPAMAEAVM